MRSHFLFSWPKFIFLSFLIASILVVIWGLVWTALTVSALKQYQLQRASKNAQSALIAVRPLSKITFHSLPDLEIWQASLEEVRILAELQQLSTPLLHQLLTETSSDNLNAQANFSQQFTSQLKQLQIKAQLIANLLPRSVISKKLLQPKLEHFISSLSAATLPLENSPKNNLVTLNTQLQQIMTAVTSEDQKVLILFQNSDELRATGGFLGSYGLFNFQKGQLQHLEIQDIYEPDGQFQGFVEAPLGLKEYLSSGHGVRLPDANWWPNFPSSAESILNFFALAKRENIHQVVAVNLSVAQEILKVTGEIYLPDYQVTVTTDNLNSLARIDRPNFFPGSQQKRNFLASLFTQLKFKLTDLSIQQQLALGKVIWQKLQTKEIQIYSTQPELEKIWKQFGFAGEIWITSEPIFSIFPVESNVGINKANKNIQREVLIQKNGTKLNFTLTLQNQNVITDLELPVPPQTIGRPLDYVDYQRLFLPTSVQIKAILVNDQPVSSWDENIITIDGGNQVKQIGFLVTVPIQQSRKVNITLELPEQMAQRQQLVLQKQSGVEPIPYQIDWDGVIKNFLVEKDLKILLKK